MTYNANEIVSQLSDFITNTSYHGLTDKVDHEHSNASHSLNRFIEATDRGVLQDAGKVTAEIAKVHAESEFEKYRIVQDRLFESDFDRMLKELDVNPSKVPE